MWGTEFFSPNSVIRDPYVGKISALTIEREAMDKFLKKNSPLWGSPNGAQRCSKTMGCINLLYLANYQELDCDLNAGVHVLKF